MPIYALGDWKPELPAEGDYWIAPNAIVIGKVRLLKGASVWFGAVLRGDHEWITIGENSNVQDNSVLHADPGQPTTVGANVTVGHKVILHSCTIGDNTLIGMGSTVLNRAKIGNSCLLGANSLVSEGKEFADGTMILGAPARQVKSLSEQQIAMLKFSAQGYVGNHKRFASDLKQIV